MPLPSRGQEATVPAHNLATVRDQAGKSPPPHFGPCTRVNIRIDLYPATRRVDYSIVVWQHPEARVIVNDVVERVGPLEHGSVVADLASHIAAIVDHFDDPFPP